MKIACYSGGFSRYPIERVFQEAERCGYDGIEIWGGRPHAYAPDLKAGDIERIKKLSREYDLPIIGFTPENIAYPFSLLYRDKRMREESLEYFKLSLDMAKEMEVPFMLVTAGHPGYGYDMTESWQIFLDSMHVLAEHAEKLDIDIALEALTPYEGSILTRSDDIVRAIRELNSPKIKGMVDFAAPFCIGEPISEYFEKLGGNLIHIHLVDNDGISDSHLVPGDGNVPLAQVLPMIERYGYKGYCSIELISMYTRDPVAYTELAIRRVAELLEG